MRWWWAVAVACVVATSAWAQVPEGRLRGVLGANKPDLLMQYTGHASSADGSAAARAVTVAMARKAIADAGDVGFGFFRVMAAGFGPVAPPPAGAPDQNDLALWRSNPARYWQQVDAMFDDLDAAGIRIVPTFVWNPMQFPALANETVADMITNPQSLSRRLLNRYISQFIARYSDRPTILFYELTNELNLEADIDIRARCLAALPAPNCAAYADFTSAEMTRFARQMTREIRALDPSRPIGSGYALPRPAAWHLAIQPDFSATGPDWTEDSRAQFRAVMAEIGGPFDLWSVHVYSGDVRWGEPPGSEVATLAQAADVALHRGKRLYLGEFGDSVASPYFMAMLHRLGNGTIAYGAVWVWEFYQQSTFLSSDITSAPPMSLEPGFSDRMNAVLTRAAGGPGRNAPASVRVVLTAPLPCAAVTSGADLYATASASGPVPVRRVAFAVDGVPVGISDAVPFHVSAPALSPGPHRIDATAYAASVSGAAQAVVGCTATPERNSR